MTARRLFFRKLAGFTALFGGTALLSACDKKTDKEVTDKEVTDKETSKTISAADYKHLLLDAFVDTVVPKDQDPGAVEAGVSTVLIAKFNKKNIEKESVFLMLDTLDQFARKQYKISFSSLNFAQRESVVKQLTHSRDKSHRLLQRTLGQQRSKIIRAFYLSTTGRAMLGYSPPYPGGYPDFNKPPPA